MQMQLRARGRPLTQEALKVKGAGPLWRNFSSPVAFFLLSCFVRCGISLLISALLVGADKAQVIRNLSWSSVSHNECILCIHQSALLPKARTYGPSAEPASQLQGPSVGTSRACTPWAALAGGW